MSGFVVFPLVGCWDIAFLGEGGGEPVVPVLPPLLGKNTKHVQARVHFALEFSGCPHGILQINYVAVDVDEALLSVHLSTQVINGNGEFTDGVTLRWKGISSRGR